MIANQYLITKKSTDQLVDFAHTTVGDYNIYTHALLEVSQKVSGSSNLVIIGYCFDYRSPHFTNQNVADSIDISSITSVLNHLRHLSGVYIVVVKIGHEVLVVPDMCALREVYYQSEAAASSPNLFTLIGDVHEINDNHLGFFQSSIFQSKMIWVGDETSLYGVRRLKPNHHLNLCTGLSTRFFPTKNIRSLSVENAAIVAANILTGIIEGATRRGAVMMGLTSGWDSRVLLCASRQVKSKILYYLLRHKRTDMDAKVSERLAKELDLNYMQQWYSDNFEVKEYDHITQELPNVNLKYPGLVSTSIFFNTMLSISGAGSEIARCEFGRMKNINGKVLATLAKYETHEHPINVYDSWLEQVDGMLNSFGYETLDFFYWEEMVANKGAKSMSESGALGRRIFPAFNCLELIDTLLSVDPYFREKQTNLLYKQIINLLWPETLKYPINPSFKKRMIRNAQALGLYSLYRTVFPKGIF